MRPIERKLLNMIKDKGITMDDVLETIDNTPTSEMKKSFQDDCLFQSDKYFAKNIINSLLRSRLIKQEGNKYFKFERKKEENKEEKE
ncbi:MAG: hypothetical protein PF570_06680 [Candidatus Cloacimonetes bacterium]|jgi:hypothetical protein|nr:hypothetical protein [Candidatus Cloacimonadota bacterium]